MLKKDYSKLKYCSSNIEITAGKLIIPNVNYFPQFKTLTLEACKEIAHILSHNLKRSLTNYEDENEEYFSLAVLSFPVFKKVKTDNKSSCYELASGFIIVGDTIYHEGSLFYKEKKSQSWGDPWSKILIINKDENVKKETYNTVKLIECDSKEVDYDVYSEEEDYKELLTENTKTELGLNEDIVCKPDLEVEEGDSLVKILSIYSEELPSLKNLKENTEVYLVPKGFNNFNNVEKYFSTFNETYFDKFLIKAVNFNIPFAYILIEFSHWVEGYDEAYNIDTFGKLFSSSGMTEDDLIDNQKLLETIDKNLVLNY